MRKALLVAAAFLALQDEVELSGLIQAINDTQIDAAMPASEKARTRLVRSFARRIIKDHNRLDGELSSALRAAGLPPWETAQTRALREDAARQRSAVSRQRGTDFDSAYVDAQADAQREMLTLLDRALEGGRPEPFAFLLQRTRDTVAGHLEQARVLQGQLEARR